MRRVADPLFYLRAIIFVSILGLLVLPLGADAINAIARPVVGARGDCRVLSVVDGDTVSLWCSGRAPERARLTGFDAPELFSPQCVSEFIAAQQATWALRAMIFRAQNLSVTRAGTDRYDRALISITLDGQAVSRKMITAGHARSYQGGHRAGWC